MKKTKKRILSLSLAFTMVVGLLPVSTSPKEVSGSTIQSNDADVNKAVTSYEVDTWDELEVALGTADETASIKLIGDILCSHEKYSSGHTKTLIRGNKTLDLNGYSIICKDKSNIIYASKKYPDEGDIMISQEKTLFGVEAGASLTIDDSDSSGKIFYDADMIGYAACHVKFRHDIFLRYVGFTTRNLFDVNGTLVINGGDIQAGRKEQQWIFRGRHIETSWKSGSDWHGYAQQQIWGSAVNVLDGGKLVINDGKITGRGMEVQDGNDDDYGGDCVPGIRDEVINIATGGKAIINGGYFLGNGGANIFAGDGVESGLTVFAGSFKTDKHDKIRVQDWNVPIEEDAAHDTFPAVGCGSYGHIGIPDSAWSGNSSRMEIIKADEVYTYPFVEMDLNETGGQESGKSLEVTISPKSFAYQESIYLNGGPYNDYPVSDNNLINWNFNSLKNLTATVDYEPYFEDTTGMRNYNIYYLWEFKCEESGIDLFTTTFGKTFDIEAFLNSKGITSFSGIMNVSCTILESAYNVSDEYRTITTFKIKSTKTPLDKTSLPGGDMKVNISYPEYSGLHSDIVMNVEPNLEQLGQAEYGSSDAIYYYTYRDNMGDSDTLTYYDGYHASNWMDWGHVKVEVEMRVQGTDGIIKRFKSHAWALKLPDVNVTGGSWNSDKTVYIGNPGTPVIIKAPIDTKNSLVEEDRIEASDIIGLYSITYDENGDAVMNHIGVPGRTDYQVLSNGLYCYGAMDRDGNIVYSKPVQVQFDEDAYSINISATGNTYTIDNVTGEYKDDITLTATVGSSVKASNVYWRVVSNPVGGDKYTSSWGIVGSGLTKNISRIFTSNTTKMKNVVPGNYAIQAFVYKDSQYIAVSNIVNIEVKRVAEYVDITDVAGNVISGETLEGPYVGDTMKLDCIPGNGASNPILKSVSWKVDSLVGTDVASIDNNGVLTAKKPGQVKVTATATVATGESALKTNTQSVIINIPITEFNVTLGKPELGGDVDEIISVPSDAPYEINYIEWLSGVSSDVFIKNSVPSVFMNIKPKEGYVLPMRQIYYSDGYTDTWFTYENDCNVTINGTKYNITELTGYGSDGYTASGEYGDFVGSSRSVQEIYFDYSWDRLIDPKDTYINYVDTTVQIPEVGDPIDMLPEDDMNYLDVKFNNSDALGPYTWSMKKVSGDYLNDIDPDNDNAVSIGDGETYEKGQVYRAQIFAGVLNSHYSSHHFDEVVTATVNGKKVLVKPTSGDNSWGASGVFIYYYFVPKTVVKKVGYVSIDDLDTPVGYRRPTTADDITEFSSSIAIGEEVYVSRMQWFYDFNNNGMLDENEDSAEQFNEDGTFIAGLRYSVYLELMARDRDGDGNEDAVKFTDSMYISLSSQGNAKMTGNQNGAVFKFPAATIPESAIVADTMQVEYELEEGYDPIQKEVQFTSVGKTTVETIQAVAENEDILNVVYDGMTVYMSPKRGLKKGFYRTNVFVVDQYGVELYKLPVAISIKEPELTLNISLDKTTVSPKSPVAITATAAGGSGSYTYKYQLANTSLTSYVNLATTSKNTYTWTSSSSACQRYIVVTVTDSSGNTATAKQLVTVENEKPLTLNILLSNTTVTTKTPVAITATAAGGSGSYTYKYQLANTALTSYVDLATIKNNTYTWTSSNSACQRYIVVTVTDGKGNTATAKQLVTISSSTSTLSVKLELSATTVAPKTPVEITATAAGGSGSYTYKYQLANTSLTSYVDLATTSKNTYTWTSSSSACQRYIVVTVTDSKGNTATVKQLVTVSTATSTLSVKLELSATTVSTKTPVKMTATATGGSGSYTYKYQLANTALTSYVDLATTSSNTYTWTSSSSVCQRYLVVTVTDGKGNTATAKQLVTIDNEKPLTLSISLSNTTVTTKTPVAITATAAGGSGSYTYKYQLANTSLTSYVDLATTSSNKYTWTSSSSACQRYLVVTVTDSKGNTVTTKKLVTVTSTPATLSVSLELSATTVSPKSAVKMTATATGGSGSYTYKYQLANTSLTSYVDLATTSSNTYTWTSSSSACQRYLVVTVTDSKGNTATTKKLVTITSTPATLSVSLELSATTVSPKSAVKMTATATGGSGSYTYKYQLANTSLTSYVDLATTSSNTYTWTSSSSACQRYLVVTVTDSKGNTATAKKLITVSTS